MPTTDELQFYREKFKNIKHLFLRSVTGSCLQEELFSDITIENTKVGTSSLNPDDLRVCYGEHRFGMYQNSHPEDIWELIESGFLTVLDALPPKEMLSYVNRGEKVGLLNNITTIEYNGSTYYKYHILYPYTDSYWDSEGNRLRKNSKTYNDLEKVSILEWKPFFPAPMANHYYVYCESYEAMGFTYHDYLDGVRILHLDKDESEWVVERK